MSKERKVLDIEELRKMSTTYLDIPNFNNDGTITVEVQKPRLMSMASQGKIPNHLLSIANQMLTGEEPDIKKTDTKKKVKGVGLAMELYARACLVDPSYEEFKDIMTDEQGNAIFSYAIGDLSELDSFRTDSEDDTDDKDGKEL